MPIRLILNGYFRSGTTLLWKLCRGCLPEGSLALYEPLHPRLPAYVLDRRIVSENDPLHGTRLWSDYQQIQEFALADILNVHANRDGKLNWSKEALFKYLDRYHDLENPVLLKTNRLHYELQNVSRRYGVQVVHIIRNPVSVFCSIRRTYLSNVGFARRALRFAGYPFWGNHAFETKNMYRKSLAHKESSEKRNLWGSLFPTFVHAWTVANAIAIDAVEKIGGKIVVFEHFLQSPGTVTADLGEYMGFPICADNSLLHLQATCPKQYVRRWRKTVRLLGLEEEMARILAVVRSSGVDWEWD